MQKKKRFRICSGFHPLACQNSCVYVSSIRRNSCCFSERIHRPFVQWFHEYLPLLSASISVKKQAWKNRGFLLSVTTGDLFYFYLQHLIHSLSMQFNSIWLRAQLLVTSSKKISPLRWNRFFFQKTLMLKSLFLFLNVRRLLYFVSRIVIKVPSISTIDKRITILFQDKSSKKSHLSQMLIPNL